MNFGLGWVRRRQRTLARVVLAVFCAAWLQAAFVPCAMAHDDSASQAPTSVHHHGDAQAGHDHGAMMAGAPDGDASPPCPYCPPDHSGADSCDGHGGCAYPHEPQVDARAAGAIFVAVPVSFVVPSAGALVVAHRVAPTPPEFIPKVSLAVSYCRFIE